MSNQLYSYWDFIEDTGATLERLRKSFFKMQRANDEVKWFSDKPEQKEYLAQIEEELWKTRGELIYMLCNYRNAYFYFCERTDGDYKTAYTKEAELLGITAGYTDEGYVYIKCPGLLPNRRGSNSIGRNPESHFFDSLDTELEKLNPAGTPFRDIYVIVLVQVYKDNTKINLLIDNDNLESKHLINIVKRHFLMSDSPFYCDLFYTFRTAEENATEIYLIPQEKFSQWFSTWNEDKKPPEKVKKTRE